MITQEGTYRYHGELTTKIAAPKAVAAVPRIMPHIFTHRDSLLGHMQAHSWGAALLPQARGQAADYHSVACHAQNIQPRGCDNNYKAISLVPFLDQLCN